MHTHYYAIIADTYKAHSRRGTLVASCVYAIIILCARSIAVRQYIYDDTQPFIIMYCNVFLSSFGT